MIKVRFQLITKVALRRLAILFLGLFLLALWAWFTLFHMPGHSYRAQLPPLQSDEIALQNQLRRDGSFWQQGYPALMVTDIAPYRYPHYHTEQDTIDKIDFEKLARVVKGLEQVISDLA